jgi:hypothetical protein
MSRSTLLLVPTYALSSNYSHTSTPTHYLPISRQLDTSFNTCSKAVLEESPTAAPAPTYADPYPIYLVPTQLPLATPMQIGGHKMLLLLPLPTPSPLMNVDPSMAPSLLEWAALSLGKSNAKVKSPAVHARPKSVQPIQDHANSPSKLFVTFSKIFTSPIRPSPLQYSSMTTKVPSTV